MFKIYDGREHFYQWDLDRKLIVGDRTIQAVHFCNRTGACAITRDCYDVNGMWLVDVPNLCLQESYRLKVYGFSAAKYTTVSAQFDVKSRTKPDGYVYTDDEVNCWQDLDQRVAALEENPVSDEAITAGIDKYLAANPIEKGATDAEKEQIARNAEDIAALKSLSNTYATEEYVDAAVANVDVDLTGYAKTEDIPSLNGYATEEYVNNAVAGAGDECVVEVVNATGEDTIELDKTYEEIQAMVDEGKVVVIKHDGQLYYQSGGLTFRYVGAAETRAISVREDEVRYSETILPTMEDVEDTVNAALENIDTDCDIMVVKSDNKAVNFKLDKTYNEIKAAIEEGKTVVVLHNNDYHYLTNSSTNPVFTYVSGAFERRIMVNSATITVKNYNYATTDNIANFQTAEQVNAAIVAYVGVIENGTY